MSEDGATSAAGECDAGADFGYRLGGRRISDIAFDCGFNDLSYFNRCFRRRFGLTPSAARGR